MRESLIQRFPILELLEDSHDPDLTSESIEELEILLEVRFPNEYADFLLSFNGGHFGRRVEFDSPSQSGFYPADGFRTTTASPADGIETYGLVKHGEDPQRPTAGGLSGHRRLQ